MSWAEVFKINSNMNKPLNEQIEELSNTVLKRSFVTSNYRLALLVDNEISESSETTPIAIFKPKINGSVRVRALLSAPVGFNATVEIYEGEIYKKALYTQGDGIDDQIELDADITVIAGKEYKFFLYDGKVHSLEIRATIIDSSTFECIIGG